MKHKRLSATFAFLAILCAGSIVLLRFVPSVAPGSAAASAMAPAAAQERRSSEVPRAPLESSTPRIEVSHTPSPVETAREAARTLLVVEVVREDDGRAIPGARVSCANRPDDDRLTDSEGKVVLAADPGQPLWLEVLGSRTGEGQSGWMKVKPLEEGEVRTLVVALRVGISDLRYFGRVVEGEGGEPIPGVEIELFENLSLRGETTSDESGLFFLEVHGWTEPYAQLSAAGLGLVRAPLKDGHETAETAQLLDMYGDARLTARVLEQSGEPVVGVEVRLEAEAWTLRPAGELDVALSEPVTWSDFSDAQGRVEISGLPSRTILNVEVRRGGERLRLRLRPEPDVFTLDPGEILDTILMLKADGEITGQVIDPTGTPVGGVPVVCVAFDPTLGVDLAGYRQEERVTLSSGNLAWKNENEGVFVFADLSLATWLVAIKGSETGVVVTLSAERFRAEEIRLETDAAFVIAGRVESSSGEALGGITIDCWAPGRHWIGKSTEAVLADRRARRVAREQTAADGSFRFESLGPGTWSIGAWDAPPDRVYAGSWWSTEEIQVEAGDEEVRITLTRVGAIGGWMVEASSGRPVDGIVEAFRDGGTLAYGYTEVGQDGRFVTTGLPAGSYRLHARSHELRSLGEEIVLRPGEVLEDIVIEMSPGGRVSVQILGASGLYSITTKQQELELDTRHIHAGARPLGPFTILPGPLRMLLFDPEGRLVGERELELTAGVHRLVRFHIGPDGQALSD